MKKIALTGLSALALIVSASVMADNHGEGETEGEAKAEAKMMTAEVGKPAPEFTLTDVHGNEHSLSDFAGKNVVLEWINFDCPFVKKFYSVGKMQEWQTMMAEQDVVWLTICSSAPGKQGHFTNFIIKEKMKELGAAPAGYLIDETGEVGQLYQAKTTPHMYVIDGEGVLRYAGAIDSKKSADPADIDGATNYVAAALTAIMAGEEVEVTQTAPYGCSVKY